MQKLNQVISVEKSVKTRVTKAVDELYKDVQKPALFNGFSKTYQPLEEEGEEQAPESLKVQRVARSVLSEIIRNLVDLFDIEATKDIANCSALVDVEVDGEVLLKQVPATYLLFLEKQITDLHTIVGKIPTLDPTEDWKFDSAINMYRTSVPVKTARATKKSKAVVLYDATPEHPAQCQMIEELVTQGHWENTKFSGAMAYVEKRNLLARIDKLRVAVKYARETANSIEAPPVLAGNKILSWLNAD